MRFFDVHTHIQDNRLNKIRDDLIRRSLVHGVEKIICCGTREGDWDVVSELAKRYKHIFASFGIHPWFVAERSFELLPRLEKLIKNSSAFVGEIGIDKMTSIKNNSLQEKIFIEQLKISQKYQRPVSIHCRGAWGVMPDLIKTNGGFGGGGLVHSWSGSSEMVKVFEKMGAYISFSGSVTGKKNKKVHRACKAVSRDRLLVETDSPDILPTGVDAELNEPMYIKKIIEKIALIRGEKEEDVALYTYENAVRLFGVGQQSV